MKIWIITLFPEMFIGPFGSSILKRAQAQGHVKIEYVNLRNFASDRYKSVDDHPYGGGTGMVLRVDIVDRAIEHVTSSLSNGKRKTVLLDPQGVPYTQRKARALSHLDHLILLCGHYEGVDDRVRNLVDEEISIGDYVLSGGEIPAMAVVDSVVRLIPGVLLKSQATISESFEEASLEYPQYTKPQIYKGKKVPTVLLSGNHAHIATWRKAQSLSRTKKRRPELLSNR